MVLITTTEIKLTVLFKAWADLSNPQARRLVMEVRSSQADPVFWWSTPLLAAASPAWKAVFVPGPNSPNWLS